MNTGKTLFAQLTYRESLSDIDVCLSAQEAKLYHMGFHEPIRRSTLADANESRDWRIYADFAHRRIGQARALYASDDLGLDLSNTVYALDSTTIDRCLSVFPWAHFRRTKAAVKMHTLLDLRGSNAISRKTSAMSLFSDGKKNGHFRRSARFSACLARPARFELTTPAFGGQYSIQLSYGRRGDFPQKPVFGKDFGKQRALFYQG